MASKLQRWNAHEGLYLQKKIGVYQALSPPLEERARGEVGGSWTRLGPTTWLPFSANAFRTRPAYGSLFLVIGRYTLIRLCFLFWFGFTLRLDIEDMMISRYMRWARFRCRCVLIVYMEIDSWDVIVLGARHRIVWLIFGCSFINVIHRHFCIYRLCRYILSLFIVEFVKLTPEKLSQKPCLIHWEM